MFHQYLELLLNYHNLCFDCHFLQIGLIQQFRFLLNKYPMNLFSYCLQLLVLSHCGNAELRELVERFLKVKVNDNIHDGKADEQPKDKSKYSPRKLMTVGGHFTEYITSKE